MKHRNQRENVLSRNLASAATMTAYCTNSDLIQWSEIEPANAVAKSVLRHVDALCFRRQRRRKVPTGKEGFMSEYFYSRIRVQAMSAKFSEPLTSGSFLCTEIKPGTVVTLVKPELRNTIDLISDSAFNAVHASSVREATTYLQKLVVGTFLIAPSAVPATDRALLLSTVESYVGIRVVTVSGSVAVVSPKVPHSFCWGGQVCVDLMSPAGVSNLRKIVAPVHASIVAAALNVMLPVLEEATSSTKRFFVHLMCVAPRTASTRAFGRALGVPDTTINSQFFRAGVPSVKTYLAMFRLLYVAAMLGDDERSIASVSQVMNYSSPQALSRHIGITFRMTGTAFRAVGFRRILDHVVRQLLVPYRTSLSKALPLEIGRIFALNRQIIHF